MIRTRMGSTDRTNARFVVAVDFGATSTSVAFAHPSSPCEIKLVQTWPNCGSADKVPTVIQYTNAQTRAYKWGYGVDSQGSSETLRWFKLLVQDQPNTALSHQQVTPPPITPTHETAWKLQKLQLSLVTVVSDFLKSVLEITKTSIEATYDSKFACDSNIEYLLTVPAMWSDSSKKIMIEAAEGAGFGSHRHDFHLISEPECAVAYTLRAIQPNHLNVGDNFIICDAGGSTMDLITYKIHNMQPLRVAEIASDICDQCGSVVLDQRFEQYIRGVLGNDVIDNMKPRSKREMMRTWEERVKFKFGNSWGSESEYEVSVPGIHDNDKANVEDGYHTIQRADIERIFNPVVDTIIDLGNQQVDRVQGTGEIVAAILLVGGLGSSEYLLNRLQNTRFGRRSTKLPVLQPMNAQTAVVRGALLRGLEGSIVQIRKARRNIGVQSTAARPQDYWDLKRNTWRSGYSSMGENMIWDQQTDAWRVKGYLNWFITKGMVLGETGSVSVELSHTVPDPSVAGDFVFHTTLYNCDLSDPPEFMWQNPSDPSTVPLSKLKKTTNVRGDSFYEVKYVLRLTLVHEVMKFESVMDGVVCGQVTAKFE